MRLKKLRCHAFTIIELLIVMFLIALVAGFIGLNILKAVRHERFSASARRVVDRLQMAQDLMLISSANGVGMDTIVSITEGEKNYYCRIGFEGKLSEKRIRIFKKIVRLEGLSEIQWQGESLEAPMTLRFSALENKIPRGMIVLESVEGEIKWIPMQGHPERYKSYEERPNLIEVGSLESESIALYPNPLEEGGG